jgi:hypothetical protein
MPAVITAAPGAITATTAGLNGTVNPDAWQVMSCAFAISPAASGVSTFPCAQQLGNGGTPIPVSATATGLSPGTTYTVMLVAASIQGMGSGNPVVFTTPSSNGNPPSIGSGTGRGPVISALKLSPTRFRRGKHAAKIAGRPHHGKPNTPIGTTISFQLSSTASVTLSFQRTQPGQLADHSCLAPSPKRHHPRRCTRYSSTSGTLTLPAHAGSNRIHFEGILDGTRRLLPGSYQLTLSGGDAAGTTTAAQHPTFTLLP